jgi:hypothetical protein
MSGPHGAHGAHAAAQYAQGPQPHQDDVADLRRLIRYVERWRLSHFQRPEAVSADSRVPDADALLRKLHNGLQLAATRGPGFRPAGDGRVFLY